MMRSLWSGVSGLKTHQLEMDVIGNNIANVNTTAFKAQSTGFADVLYQTVKQGSGAGDNIGTTNASQVGLGAKVGSIYTSISTPGSMQTTGNVMDLMITGDSFFCIGVGGNEINYTRDGSFTIDSQGYLVTQNKGNYVMGVMGEGGIPANPVITNMQVINVVNGVINDTMAGQATSQAYFKGNVDSHDDLLQDGREGRTVRLEVFGNDGNKYTLKFVLSHQEGDDTNVFNLNLGSMTDENGTKINIDGIDDKLIFDKHNGKLIGCGADGSSTSGIVTYNFTGDASMVGPITVDFNNVTNYANGGLTHSSTINSYRGDLQGLNKGYANGTLSGISFGVDGSVYGTYSNGQTVKKGQIAVAQFQNASGLEMVGDNLYAESLNSGVPNVIDVTSDGGYLNSGVLEASNVNLAKEFTDMITTQRGFQANSRVITTSDEMLQLLKQLKR